MFNIIRAALDKKDISFLWDLYYNSNNRVVIDNNIATRHIIDSNRLGRFQLALFTQGEFKHIGNKITNIIQNYEKTSVDGKYFRILTYTKGCYIRNHKDSPTVESPSNTSVIIQLSSPEDFTGGNIIIRGKKINLQVGDLVYYSYNYEHEVTKVLTGKRIVSNLRCYVKPISNLI